MDILKKLIVVLILVNTVLNAQKIYELPLNSEGNIIKLGVVNSSDVDMENIRVSAVEYPEWIKFGNDWQSLDVIKAGERSLASFIFDVTSQAPLNTEEKIKFIVSSNKGMLWQKEIKIVTELPKEFSLEQNYPNPFNPETTISYQLPEDSKVTIKIFDILGKEVHTLISENQAAGIHKQIWNASNFASGLYVYQLIAESVSGEQKVFRKKMMLVK